MSDIYSLASSRAGSEDDPFGSPGNAAASSSRAGRTPSRKRNADSAQLPESSPAHPLRRSLIKAQIGNTSLEAKIFALEQRLKRRDEELDTNRQETEKLMQDRRNLNRGYEAAIAARDQARQDLEAEKAQASKNIEGQHMKRRQLEDQNISLRDELASLGRTHAQTVSQSRSEKELLQQQIDRLQEERDSLVHMRQQAHSLSEALERKERELEDVRTILTDERERSNRRPDSSSRSGSGSTPSSGAETDLKAELKRQASMLNALGKTNQTLQKENAELRLRRDNVEMLNNEVKALGKKAKVAENKLAVCQEALDRARKDMDMLTINVPLSAGNMSEDHTTTSTTEYLSLQHRLSQLSAAHSLCGQTISAKQNTILDYSNRLEQISRETAMTMDELQKRSETAERELRWANEGRQSAEKRLRLAREELEVLRSNKVAPGTGIENPLTESGAGEVEELRRQVDLYRRAIDDFQEDNRDNQAKAILDLDLVKRADLTAALERCKGLDQEMEIFKQTITQHEERYEDVRKAAEDMEARLGSGEYNTKVWRAVEFSGNPAAKDYAIRKETLEKLKQENEALIAKVTDMQRAGASTSGTSEKTVPIEVFERLREEQEAEKALHEKRLLRLREAFAARSKEFLESVQSLLGWRVRFGENGSDVRLESMYAAKSGKMGLRLVFKSEGGHFGTMKMMGGMGKNLEHVKEYWVLQRQSIPGFLAQVTLEAFEKTTIGRLAGYAGNEDVEEDEE